MEPSGFCASLCTKNRDLLSLKLCTVLEEGLFWLACEIRLSLLRVHTSPSLLFVWIITPSNLLGIWDAETKFWNAALFHLSWHRFWATIYFIINCSNKVLGLAKILLQIVDLLVRHSHGKQKNHHLLLLAQLQVRTKRRQPKRSLHYRNLKKQL